jgi:hypothetical protein
MEGGEDVHVGLTDQMIYRRHVGGNLAFLYVLFGSISKTFASSQNIL